MSTIEKTAQMESIARTMTNMLHECNPYADDITIRYIKTNQANICTFSDWQRRYHDLLTGCEYFLIYEKQHDGYPDFLLYAINVTADAPLTAVEELMRTVAAKF